MNILLVCSAGMSTSLIVKKMQDVADKLNFESKIWAVSTDQAKENMPNADVVLIGPQIRFMKAKLAEQAKAYNIPVDDIDPKFYGMAEGEKILLQAIKLKKSHDAQQ